MDILFLSQYFFPEQFLNNHVARELVARGHRVNVVTCVPNYPAGSFFDGYSNRKRTLENWNGVEIFRVPTVARGASALQLIANYLVYPVAASWRILRMGRRRGDISFVSMPSPLLQALAGIFAKKVWKIPTIFWVQDIWPDSAIITIGIRNRVAIRALNALCGWIYRQADLVMVQSDGFHGRIAGFGVLADRIMTLPNFAPATFQPVAADAAPASVRAMIPTGRRVLMFAGNIGESQDFDTIIAAAKLLPADTPLLLAVVGSGRDEDRVRAKVAAENLSDRFLFLGRHAEADMPHFFACADAMLVSLRDEPIFALTIPSKVQAYMACGKPMLASLAGEAPGIIDKSGAGKCVPPGSPAALAALFEQFVAMPQSELDAMGRNARAVYEAMFSLEAVVSRLEEQLVATLRKTAG